MNCAKQPKLHHFFILLTSLFWGSTLYGQIEVEPTGSLFTPKSLISSVFLGEGVEVLEITHNGTANSVGYFTNGTDNVGINRGIVMSTGRVIDIPQSNESAGTSGSTSGNSNDPYLGEISDDLNDNTKYTIRFIPTSDTLRFRYTFASEEYPEYACSNFNDIFGFFIHGPGITGPYPNNAYNIALIPELSDPTGLTFTDLPVTINNVNPGQVGSASGDIDNCTPPEGSLAYAPYYRDNSGNPDMMFDGYLRVFFAQAIVTPCEEYTIVLSIADVGDDAFDSAVFLEARSFGTGSLNVDIETVSLDGSLSEGCTPGELTFRLPSKVEDDYFIDYTVFGTATNGVDYSTIPDNIFIPAGDSVVTIPVEVYDDGIDEDIETIGIDIQRDPCNRDTFYFLINDNRLIDLDLGPDTTICNGASVQFDGTMDVPLPEPPNFSNTTDYDIVVISANNPPPPGTPPTISPINVLGIQPLELQPDVLKSVCINIDHKWISDIDVFLFAPDGNFLELTTDNGVSGDHYTETCFTPSATDPIDFGSSAPAAAAPFTGDWLPEGNFEDLYGSPTNGEWQLSVKIDQQGFDGTLLDWSICFNPVYQIKYNWSPAEGLSCTTCPNPIATPTQTTTYTLEVTDTYGCAITDEITVNVNDGMPAPVVNCTPTTNSLVLDWADVLGADSYEININGTGWIPTSGNLQHVISNLGLNETVSFEIRGIGDCDSEIFAGNCTTLDCTPPTVVIDNVENVNCHTGTDGSISVLANGTAPPYEFSIPGIATNDTGVFNGLTAGIYTVVINDALGCPGSMDIEITEPAPIDATIQIVDSISCNGIADGQITAVITGGTGPYQFNWNNNAGTDSIFSTAAQGMIDLILTDNQNCGFAIEFEMPEPEILAASVNSTAVNCFGGNDGTATVLASGGTAPYTYLWSNDDTADTASGLAAGNESVTVTDNNGCQTILAVEISENDPILLDFDFTLPACNGIANGNITVLPSGGDGNYSYEWSNGMTFSIAGGLGQGTHSVTVTDGGGCIVTGEFELGEPDPISIEPTIVHPLCANDETGEIALTVAGGNGGYTFAWSDDNTILDDNRTSLAAGSYTVTVVDEVGCQNNLVIGITEPAALEVETTTVPVGCAGGATGAVSATVIGGSGDITYAWDINGTILNTQTVENLPADTYGLTITDINNCTYTNNVEVLQSAGIDVAETIAHIDCFGGNEGSISLNISGGNAPYILVWTDENNNVIGDTENIDNLAAGVYQINITDANNCLQTNIFEVTENTLLELAFVNTANIACPGGTDGSINLSVVGGDGNYSFEWSNNSDTEDLENLAANEYRVTVTDGVGCSDELATTLTQPDDFQIQENITAVSCFGNTDGAIEVTITGGTVAGDYQYIWSNGGSTLAINNNLPAGNHQLTVLDDNGCSTSVDFNVDNPAEIEAMTDIVPVSCNGTATGEATINATGGNGNFTYDWGSNANNQTAATAINLLSDIYFVTVTDGNGCTTQAIAEVVEPLAIQNEMEPTDVDCFGAETGAVTTSIQGGVSPYSYNWIGPNGYTASTADLTELEAGVYDLTVTDDNNCVFTETVTIAQPATGLTVTATAQDTVCFGLENGVATATPAGGTGTADYLWSYQNQTTATVNNLPAGNWEVVVTDASGCSATASTLIEANPAITVDLEQRAPLCHNGTDGTANILHINSGGNPDDVANYSIVWNTNETTPIISGLISGSVYDVIVTDRLGCTASANIEIENPAPVGILAAANESPDCFGGNNGAAAVSGAGGLAPYTYLWSTNAASQTTARAENLSAGTYQVTVADANGCESVLDIEVNQPELLDIDFTVGEISCPGDADGAIAAAVTGGAAPFGYAWSTGATTAEINEITAGDYVLTVTDGNGCTTEATQTIDLPAILEATTTVETPDCFGASNGRITINPTGGIAPYTYALDTPNYGGSPTQLGIGPGTYIIYVQDSNGCTFSDEVTVEGPERILVDAGDDVSINLGDSLQLSAIVTHGAGDLMIEWNGSYDGTLACEADTIRICDEPWAHPKYTIMYDVVVVDENGCIGADELEVTVVKARQVMAPTAFTPNGDGANDRLVLHGVPNTKVVSFKVFDRWGSLLFANGNFMINEVLEGWDGSYRSQRMATGIYMWVAEVEYEDGATGVFSGETTLLR